MVRNKAQETILVLLPALVVVWWFKRSAVILVCAGVTGLLALVFPVVALFIHRCWMGLAKIMGKVMGTLLLSIVYVLVLLPLSLLSRSLKKGPVRKKEGSHSYFSERDHEYTKEDLVNPW